MLIFLRKKNTEELIFNRWLRSVVRSFTGNTSEQVKTTSEANYEPLMFIWQKSRQITSEW